MSRDPRHTSQNVNAETAPIGTVTTKSCIWGMLGKCRMNEYIAPIAMPPIKIDHKFNQPRFATKKYIGIPKKNVGKAEKK